MRQIPCQWISGIGGGTSVFQNDISLFDRTCLRDSIPKWDSRTSHCVWMLLSRNVQHDDVQETPATCICDGWRRRVHVCPCAYVHVHCHSASPPSEPEHRLSLMRGLDLMRCCGTLSPGTHHPPSSCMLLYGKHYSRKVEPANRALSEGLWWASLN